LQVVDNGPGIPAAERAKVLERFYRMAGSKEQGSGLGLAIVKEICASHGIELELAEAPGGAGGSAGELRVAERETSAAVSGKY
jgi:signal transduction histidine kinase